MKRRLLLAWWCLVAVGCDTVSEPPTAALSMVVTGAAASARDAHGKFVLAANSPLELSETEANAIALAYARGAAPWLEYAWEKDRGSDIDVERLRPCGRSYYARSAFEPTPQQTGRAVQRLTASKWLVSLCDEGGTPQVSLAVPANATDARAAGNRLAGMESANILSVGIPTHVGNIPPVPEAIAQEAARLTGRRVKLVPELILPPPPLAPQLARWRITLEEVIDLADSDGKKHRRDEVFLGFASTWHEKKLQIGTRSGRPFLISDPERGGGIATLTLSPSYPDEFTPVTVERR